MVLLLQYTLIFASVLILVALGGCFAEHSGVINLGLEGIMIMGALGGALAMRYISPNVPAIVMILGVLAISALVGMIYSCLLAALGAALIWGVDGVFETAVASGGNIALALGTGIVTCYLPYLLYTYGLTGLETGRASIMASVEPVVATLVGALVFHESMSLLSALGVALVLAAVVLLNLRLKPRV